MDEAIFEDIQEKITSQIRKAKDEIKMCVAWINFKTYAQAIKEALDKGVKVEIIYNDDSNNLKTINYLDDRARKIPIKTKSAGILMHNKFCIIDNEIIITGSYNWSNSAPNHFENIVILHKKYKLVKRFLHEFEELRYYNKTHAQQVSIICKQPNSGRQPTCRSTAYNIIIIGDETGKYQDSEVEKWRICKTQRHAKLLGASDEQHLFTRLGWIDTPEPDEMQLETEKEIMLYEFKMESEKDRNLQEYFNNNINQERIHAIGRVGITNWIEHSKFHAAPERGIMFLWKDIYHRKQIPDIIYEEESEDIEDIIRRHSP